MCLPTVLLAFNRWFRWRAVGRSDTVTQVWVRDYDPMIGRWIAKDPLGFGGSLANLYRYSRNDPINWSDPSGLFITPTHEEIISDTFIGRLPYADRAIL